MYFRQKYQVRLILLHTSLIAPEVGQKIILLGLTFMTEIDEIQVLQRLTNVFRDVFDDEKIILNQETTAHDIEEWDSLNQIKIILACEKEFGVKLNARDINTLEDVGAMLEHLRKFRI